MSDVREKLKKSFQTHEEIFSNPYGGGLQRHHG